MAEQRISKGLAWLLAGSLLASLGMASEYHGTVNAGGQPLPGATVTAARGDSKIVTTTDEKGAFSFRDLPDGNWTIDVEMLGFEKLTREVGVAPDAPPPAWDMKFLSEAALTGGLDHGGSVVPPTRAANSFPAAPPATRSTARADFQRTSVTQSAESSTFSSEGTIKTEEAADLSQSSANSFIVQGSVSSAAGMVPSVTRVFRKDQEMYVYLEAYQPSAQQTQFMVATVAFYRGKVKAFETAPLKISEGLNAKSKAVPVSFSFPLEKLEPGRYTCQVSVVDPSVQKFAVWRSPIAVLPK